MRTLKQYIFEADIISYMKDLLDTALEKIESYKDTNSKDPDFTSLKASDLQKTNQLVQNVTTMRQTLENKNLGFVQTKELFKDKENLTKPSYMFFTNNVTETDPWSGNTNIPVAIVGINQQTKDSNTLDLCIFEVTRYGRPSKEYTTAFKQFCSSLGQFKNIKQLQIDLEKTNLLKFKSSYISLGFKQQKDNVYVFQF
jgi:hypothetical protein